MIHLDTNFLVDALVPTSKQSLLLTAWLENGHELGMSSVAWGEFLCGPVVENAVFLSRQIIPVLENLTGDDAELAARLFNQSGRRSKSFADCSIAAVAMRCNAGLASGNRADFEPLISFGLKLL